MEEQLESLIRKIIFKKYPHLTDVKVGDVFKNMSSFENLIGSTYTCQFTSDECLSMEEHMDIDTEVKTLFKMLSYENSNPFSIREPKISCYFDCGEGFEFHSKYGYKH